MTTFNSSLLFMTLADTGGKMPLATIVLAVQCGEAPPVVPGIAVRVFIERVK